MVPQIYDAIERAVAQGMSPEEAARVLIGEGMPEKLVNEVTQNWMQSHGRSHPKTSFSEFIKTYKQKAYTALIIIGSLGIFGSLVTLLKPWPTKIMIDSAFGDVTAPGFLAPYSQTPKLILFTSLMTLLIFVISAIINTTRDYLLIRMSYLINSDFKEKTLRHILNIPANKGVFSKGDYIYRQNNLTNSMADYVLGSTSMIVQSASMIVIILAVMMVFEPKLTLICLILLPSLYILTKILLPKVSYYSNKLARNNSQVSSIITESVDNAETIQSYEMAENQVTKARNLWANSYMLSIKSLIFSRFYKISNSLLVIVSAAIVMYLGGTAALRGEITLGELLIFMTYLGYLLGPIQNLTNQMSSRRQRKIDIARVYEVLSENEGIEASWDERHFPVRDCRIEIQNLSYSYGKMQVLNGINMTIEPGQKIGIIGESGSGKSTFLKILSLFVEPTNGKIAIDNIDIQSISLKELRRVVAFVGQNPQLFNSSILENVLDGSLGHQIPREYLDRIVKDMGIYDFSRLMPEGLNTLAGENGSKLSGGQKQRVALARGLAKNARILCLDEPTSALDNASEQYIKEHLPDYLHGRTVFLVSHRKALLTLMDVVYVLKDGKLTDVNQLGGLDKCLDSFKDKEAEITTQQVIAEEQQLLEKIKQEEIEKKEQEAELSKRQKVSESVATELGDDVTINISH